MPPTLACEKQLCITLIAVIFFILSVQVNGRKLTDNLRLTLVVSHCNENMGWMKRFLKGASIQDITIYAKCGSTITGYVPPGSEIVQLPNLGRCDHTWAYWMSKMEEEDATDNHLVLFLKASRDNSFHSGMSYRSLQEMTQITKKNGFACGYSNDKFLIDSKPLTSDLRSFSMPDYKGVWIKSDYENMGEWADSMGITLPSPRTSICYGGNFMVKASQIYSKQDQIKNMRESLVRYNSNEEGHFAERSWAVLLTQS